MTAIFAFDISANEALTYAVIAALITLVPLMGTLAVVAVQQYYRVREAVAIGQQNHVALHDQVLPQLAQLQQEGQTNHAETISAINGGVNNTPSGGTH